MKKLILLLLIIISTVPCWSQARNIENNNLQAAAMPTGTFYKVADYDLVKKIEQTQNIYSDWHHGSVRGVKGTIPSNFKIDLRNYVMPTTNRKITSRFGPRWGRRHEGLDIKVYVGDTIVSAFDGKVRIVRCDRNGWGNFVVVRHPNGLETLYAHLSKQLVKEDQEVKAGEPIGLGGNTGRSTGSHLHFECRVLGKLINPELLFDFPNQDVKCDFYSYFHN